MSRLSRSAVIPPNEVGNSGKREVVSQASKTSLLIAMRNVYNLAYIRGL